ncbi:MAG: hypothetical protein O7E54_08430 [Planctomycetota bacterium]|nr:hypothetical protein [Planctomycetota bacterium]
MRVSIALLLLAVVASAGGIDKKTLKEMEVFAAQWWKLRPKTKFDRWDPKARAEMLEKAAAFGTLPEGSLGTVVAALRKSLKRHGPKAKGSGKARIKTPYGDAWFYSGGWSGKNKGLVLGLHGGGEGAGSADEPRGKWKAKNCGGMYPQGIRLVHDTWNTVHGEKFILTMIEIAKAQYDIDCDRVYSMGFSMGGTGSWFMAGRHPDLLAGSSPCAGVLMAMPKSQLERKEDVQALMHGILPNVRNLAMYYYIGLADRNCMPGTYLAGWDELEELRRNDPHGYKKIQFKTYPGLAHAFPPGEPNNGIKWLEQQTRDTYPRKIVWETVLRPFPLAIEADKTGRYVKRHFYWLHHARPADRMLITATREGNAIDLDLGGEDKEDVTVFLNPDMIEVRKEVVVTLDGEEVYRGKPAPDFITVLETFDANLDKRLCFDRRVEFKKGRR